MVCEIASDKAIRFICIESGSPITYLLRVSSKEEAINFYQVIQNNKNIL